MEWGSSYIYDYQHSEEEEVSGSELEEGMWLSDSEGEEQEPLPHPPPPPHTNPLKTSKPGFLSRMFGRNKTGKDKTPLRASDSDTDDESDDPDDIEDKPQQVPDVNYAELDLSPKQDRDYLQIIKDGEEVEGSPGKYAQLAELQKQMREEEKSSTDPHIPVVSVQDEDDIIQTPLAATALPPPPPPAPMKHLHGILKGGIKKQKKRRIRWDRSYRNKPKDSSRVGVRTRRTDTNVLAVKFNSLAEAGHLHTGDAEVCSNEECGAIVSHLTKLEGAAEDDDDKFWVCEFCGTRNVVNLVPEEIPTAEDTTYLLTPAAALQSDVGEGVGPVGSDSLVVFCIDTSGSMCVTTEVPGTHDLRGAKEKHEKLLQSLPTGLDVDIRREELQYMIGQRRNVTYISRMESVQAAVDTQLSQLVHTEPSKRVCLVTFSDDVVIFGDGRSVPVTLAGDKLSNSKAVVDAGKESPLPAAIRDTHKALSKKIFGMEESGQTALGPAVLVSIVIASQKPGSKVIVCTDGLANVGLGGLDVPEKAYASAVNFYDDLADIAMEKGVTMSLLKIKGGDCRAVELGQVASRTGGHVTLVDPMTVTEEFGSILTNPVIATDVVSKVVLHQGLYFRSPEDTRESVLVKQVGNVTADTELTYEYGIKTKTPPTAPKDLPKKPPNNGSDEEEVKSKGAEEGGAVTLLVPPVAVGGHPHYPFQLQIEYTSLEGDKCLRVITQTKPVTRDRDLAEREMDVGVIGSHVARQTAELTMQGEFTKARVKSLSAQKMLHEQSRSSDDRRWEYTNFCYNMIPMENEIHFMQQSEVRNRSDSEGEEECIERGSELMEMSFAAKKTSSSLMPKHSSAPSRLPPKRKAKEVSRRQELSDELSVGLFGMKKSHSHSYRSPTSSSLVPSRPKVVLPPRAETIAIPPTSRPPPKARAPAPKPDKPKD